MKHSRVMVVSTDLVLLDYLFQRSRDRWDWRRSKAEFGITMDSVSDSLSGVA